MLDNILDVVLFLSNAFFVVKMISIAWISQVRLHLKHVSTVIVDEYMCLRLVEFRSDIWLLSVKFTSNHYMYNVIEYFLKCIMMYYDTVGNVSFYSNALLHVLYELFSSKIKVFLFPFLKKILQFQKYFLTCTI